MNKPTTPRRLSNDEIVAWGDRHGIDASIMDLRAMVEDAMTLRQTQSEIAPANAATQDAVEAHPPCTGASAPAVAAPSVGTPRTPFTPEAWAAADWAIPHHIHPSDAANWLVANCDGDWEAPTPEMVRKYIAQAVYRHQQQVEKPRIEQLERELAEAKQTSSANGEILPENPSYVTIDNLSNEVHIGFNSATDADAYYSALCNRYFR